MEDLAFITSQDRFNATAINLRGNLEDFVFSSVADTADIKMSIISPEEEPNYVTTMHYRGYDVPIFYDDPGQQFYCRFTSGTEMGFGSFNADYEDDLRYIIDHEIDTIRVFESPYWGARLEWFDNSGFRDIRLIYRMRILRVFPTVGKFDMTYQLLEQITQESIKLLDQVVEKPNEK